MTGLLRLFLCTNRKIAFLLIGASKWVLVLFQNKRCNSSEHQRLKNVSTLNIKEVVSFL